MTMNTGDVSRRLGLPVTAEQLEGYGFKPSGRDKRAVLWDEDDYPAMCDAIAEYVLSRKAVPMQPRPDRPPAKGKPKASETKAGAKPPADDDEEL